MVTLYSFNIFNIVHVFLFKIQYLLQQYIMYTKIINIHLKQVLIAH